MNDEFLTIDNNIGEARYTEKCSKFLAFSHHVTTEDEIKSIISTYRKKYYDARHVCFAYMLGADYSIFKANDDGEPSSTAGIPILGQIKSNNLTNILIIVVRYFGGIKLGTSGLISAYKTAAAMAIEASNVITTQVEESITYTFPYVMMNGVMRVVKETSAKIINQTYDNTCSITLSIRKSQKENLQSKLDKLAFL